MVPTPFANTTMKCFSKCDTNKTFLHKKPIEKFHHIPISKKSLLMQSDFVIGI
ncbi:unnamed protein product [Acanthoscelides obtectus]|uniref:Uncharacterized protein n=1 Tax=Acanthoscelides obtectus TaxID=200917 RepID=A0A9P0JQK3_ACAOB|nr:unnamed protein product [Acanthoscelides obtectus]CAK1661773.1 hypothetical protein AOBTE_LOCUS22790 [Acanthoscelides obtectus]